MGRGAMVGSRYLHLEEEEEEEVGGGIEDVLEGC